MNREEVKQEVARMIYEQYSGETSEIDAESLAEDILSFLDDIGYDSYPELHPNEV